MLLECILASDREEKEEEEQSPMMHLRERSQNFLHHNYHHQVIRQEGKIIRHNILTFLNPRKCDFTTKGAVKQWKRSIVLNQVGQHKKCTINGPNQECVLVKNCRTKKSFGIPATFENGYSSNSEEDEILWNFKRWLIYQLNLLYQFSRPHTVIGTIIGITSVALLPVQNVVELSPLFFVGLLKALVPSVLMNIYVVGLNQLFDVEIDKVNKPNLPLASGDLSMGTGTTIVIASLLMSLAMGIMFQSPALLCALLISCLLGSVYSIELPLLRWKKQAFLAAGCIMIVRAIVVQIAFFIHIQKFVLGKPIVITRSLVFATAFMCFFSAVIALFKDIPDVDGDRDFGIQSFSVNLGTKTVFWACVNMLLVAYGAAVVVGSTSSVIPSKIVTILGHCILAFLLWARAKYVDLSSKVSITSFYMFIWKLFYVEYFLIPFVR